jgi:hypothetical protein
MQPMSGTMRIDQSFTWTTQASQGGHTVGRGTAELSVVIHAHGDTMPDGTALSQRVRELFTRALGDALRTEDQNGLVARKEHG